MKSVTYYVCVQSYVSVTNWAVQFPKYDVKQYTKSLKVVSVPIKDSAVFMVRMMVLVALISMRLVMKALVSLMLNLVSLGSKTIQMNNF